MNRTEMQKRINEKYADEPLWSVTVKPNGLPVETYEVRSPREGLARTNAMILYSHTLRGQFVDYEVTRIH